MKGSGLINILDVISYTTFVSNLMHNSVYSSVIGSSLSKYRLRYAKRSHTKRRIPLLV